MFNFKDGDSAKEFRVIYVTSLIDICVEYAVTTIILTFGIEKLY